LLSKTMVALTNLTPLPETHCNEQSLTAGVPARKQRLGLLEEDFGVNGHIIVTADNKLCPEWHELNHKLLIFLGLREIEPLT
jgi:hypothetical protein